MPSPALATSSTRPKPPRKSSLSSAFGRLMRVYGHSMAPLLHPGQLVLVQEDVYASRQPHRGEIIAARPHALGGQALVKRVTGLPHERVQVGDREWTLGEDEFFLLSDRQEHSLDSRIFGPVTRDELIGPVKARVWPWKRLQAKTAMKDDT